MSEIRNPQSAIRNPLRILMAADVDPARVIGGAERIVREHSTRLAARGHQVVVLTRREDPDRPEREAFEGVEVYRHPVRNGSALAFVRSAIREGARAFAEICQGWKPDVLNMHQPLAAAGVLRAPQSANVPRVYTYLSPWADEYRVRAARAGRRGWPGRLAVHLAAETRRRVERDAVRACGRIQVLSEFSAGQVTGIHGVPREKIEVIPGAADTARFRPAADRLALRAKLGLPPDRFVMLTVRNLVPRMGLEALVEAMAVVGREVPDILLLIGGSGPLAEPLRQQAHALGLDEAVRFVGFVPEEQLPDYYAAADLFLLPTACLEGFGLVTVEALACGTPVLGTPIGGTPEILRALDPGLLFAGTSADHLARGILAQVPRVRGNETLRRHCREYADERYSWNVIIPRIETLFYQAAGRLETRDKRP